MRWTTSNIPDQTGRTAVVTGANTGLGYETARLLTEKGATVILACRDLAKARRAASRLGSPRARTLHLDLASPGSIRSAARELEGERVDLLINNAGGIRPRHAVTGEGFELTFATNHLGTFAFTGLMLERLLAVPGSRVVTVSSIGHRRGTMNFEDLHFERGYDYQKAYFQSKLANLLFSYELHRRLTEAEAATISVAAHPGNARTEFGRDMSPFVRLMMRPVMRPLTWWLMHDPEVGALAAVRAAVDPSVRGGEFYGPPGRSQFTGHPERIESSLASYDADAQRRLWAESERLTGVVFSSIPARPAPSAG
ncbi:SDR family NAD(P)-dependent oxidoreductase [Acrocarpospora macrocephala]|uniref:Short-chain dehydrogenase n=1 Tax=Acrocarpospora macrocephala TaxID=150177 RepID=A0A5M3X016_9ACTN|nr:oxidoreductase [Acrocarpospora macrocephala]GES12053.1 short-chain dehydrogenase [Acrocarpospora macrocephala]